MPLTAEQMSIVKSTVPILEQGGEALTKHFYKIMLTEYDEVKPLFNQAHQISGDQPRALANSILRYAKNIDKLQNGLGPLGDLPAQIVNKHVGLNVLPEHYPIVGTCLLRAIREVLGPQVATDQVIEAWGAAYNQLADILIAVEASVYEQKAAKVGGWKGKRAFYVSKKIVETREVTSFYLKPLDGQAIVDFVPGQYIGITLTIDGKEVRRNYSLSDAPNGQYYRLSIKREKLGVVSNYMHDKVTEGTTLELFPPTGHFNLAHNDKHLVLISGGVGLTPVLSMLNHTLSNHETKDRPITYIHFTRNYKVHAFHNHLSQLSAKHPNLTYYYAYDEHLEDAPEYPHFLGKLTQDQLQKWLPNTKHVDVYFLGPKPFMRATKFFLKNLGVPENQTFYEFFGPAEALKEPEQGTETPTTPVDNPAQAGWCTIV